MYNLSETVDYHRRWSAKWGEAKKQFGFFAFLMAVIGVCAWPSGRVDMAMVSFIVVAGSVVLYFAARIMEYDNDLVIWAFENILFEEEELDPKLLGDAYFWGDQAVKDCLRFTLKLKRTPEELGKLREQLYEVSERTRYFRQRYLDFRWVVMQVSLAELTLRQEFEGGEIIETKV